MVTRDDILTLAVRAERSGQRRLASVLFALGALTDGRGGYAPPADNAEWRDVVVRSCRDGVALANKLLVAGS